MIYEATLDSESMDDAARAAVQAKCDKFLHGGSIYQVTFHYREIEKVTLTNEEEDRQFRDK